jgi:2-polyprenyl-3-methyl-5-hydroxy-6-metoxy-1,4-benzoquinol methylase
MIRCIELGSGSIHIREATELENEAGAVVWDAALVLIGHLIFGKPCTSGTQRRCHEADQYRDLCTFLRAVICRAAASITGSYIIDVGAGTGAVGLAAAALGAKVVVVTDLPHLRYLIESNITHNGLSDTARFAELSWGSLASWRDFGDCPPDFILASDVIYDKNQVQPLIDTLQRLCGVSTTILLAIEHRSALPFPEGAFTSSGFVVEAVPHSEHHPDWSSPDIELYSIKLAKT